MSELIATDQINSQIGAELPPESKFYFNGFYLVMSPMDCSIVLLHNNRPIGMLNTTHVIAKTLSYALDGLIKDFEDKTKQHIMKLDEISELLKSG
jgi:hypothetical protein